MARYQYLRVPNNLIENDSVQEDVHLILDTESTTGENPTPVARVSQYGSTLVELLAKLNNG